MKYLTNKLGFTLMEILAVIGILGIILVWAISTFSSSSDTAKIVVENDSLSQIMSSLESYKQINKKYPLPSNWSWDTISNGDIGLLANNQNIDNFMDGYETDDNWNFLINDKNVYYATTVNGEFYAIWVVSYNPETELNQNNIRSNSRIENTVWTLFNNGSSVLFNWSTNALLSSIATDGTLKVSQGFYPMKRDTNVLRIQLFSPLGTGTANETATENLFDLNGMIFGSNTSISDWEEFIDFLITDSIDISEDSVSPSNNSALDNESGLRIDSSFPSQEVRKYNLFF